MCVTRVHHNFQGLTPWCSYHAHIISSIEAMVCTAVETLEYMLLHYHTKLRELMVIVNDM
jgi:hypothetical protein